MTTQRVSYDSDETGFWWVDGDDKGEPQKDLHHAMKDYDNHLRKEAQNAAEESAAEAERTSGSGDGDAGDDDEEADPYAGEG